MSTDPTSIVRRSFEAYATGDRSLLDDLFTDDFLFFAPPDPGIDLATYFERCWPGHAHIADFAFVRLAELDDDEVLVTYEATRTDGTRFRNTEIFTLRDERIARVEVYFGWDLTAG